MLRKISLAFAALLLSTSAFAANVPAVPSTPTITATASASWATSASTITLNAICPIGILPGAAVYDTTLSGSPIIGYAVGCNGVTLQLNANALLASSGSTDALKIAGVGPAFEEPSQTLAALGYYNNLVNAYAGGLLAALQAPLNPSSTSAVTILSSAGVTLPLAGQAIRVHAWGVNGGSASTNTITLNFGASGTCAVVVTATSAKWYVEGLIQNVGTIASPAWQGVCWGQQGSTAIAIAETSGTDALATTAQTLSLTTTATVASQQTVQGATIEYVR